MIKCLCVCSSCDLSSASVQVAEAVDQNLDAEDAGKLTEADKAQTGRVGHPPPPTIQSNVYISIIYHK